MNTVLSHTARVSPDHALDILRTGGVLVFPTETFFGLGSRALDPDATARIFLIKHRSTMRSLPLIAGDMDQVHMVGRPSQAMLALTERFWPGPLTLIMPARLRTPDVITGGTGKVAVRISSHPVCAGLTLALGEPITSSSANISGQAPVTRGDDLDIELIRHVDGVLDGYPPPSGGLPSTLIEQSLTDPLVVYILREGAISSQSLREAGFCVQEKPEGLA